MLKMQDISKKWEVEKMHLPVLKVEILVLLQELLQDLAQA